jgi:two-component system, OmpR family, response regulator
VPVASILVVDDEAGVRDLLCDALRIAGHEPESAGDGQEALTLYRRRTFDLCIVDINMPTMDGFAFVETVRQSDDATPVLLLSARDAAQDVTHGLRVGADDYVRKPFGLEELLLRVEAILRRAGAGQEEDQVYRCGPLAMNLDRHEVTYGEETLEMSATEFHLLEVLMARKGRLLTREQLLRDVWGIDFDSETSVLDTYISYLRKKVHREGFSPIVTVRGVGYKLVDNGTE